MARAYLGYLVMDSKLGPALPMRCVEGAYGKSFWRGKKTVNIERQYHIDTFRCAACGFLESYAAHRIDEGE